ncbi:MAG: FMN-binding protein [Gemmatimonadota bacterium]
MEAKRNYIGQAWLVILLSLGFGGALAGVQVKLEGRIAANKLAETLGQVPQLVPGAEQGEQRQVAGQIVYRALAGGQPVGWVIPASGQGFADRIELLLGVDPGVTRITGLYILDQKETPGLGNKIIEAGWRRQFGGKSTTAPLSAKTGGGASGNQIDAVTGATISSVSVCDIINANLAQMRPILTAASGGE